MSRPYPLDPQGPLPERLPAELLARALEKMRLPTAHLIRKLRAPLASTNAKSLRRALDNPRSRQQLQALSREENVLALALFNCVVQTTKHGQWLDKYVFRPACLKRGDKNYIDVARFPQVLAKTEPQKLATNEFCYLVLAFGILQQESADKIVQEASNASPLVAKFFGLVGAPERNVSPILQQIPAQSQNTRSLLVSARSLKADVATRAPTALIPVGDSPARQPPTAIAELPPEQQQSILELRRVLEHYAEASLRLRSASSSGAWDELAGLANQLKALEQEGRSLISDRLAKLPGGEQLSWSQSPPAGRDEARARCDEIADILLNARRNQAQRLEQERAALVATFHGAGLVVPDALADATTLEALCVFRDAYAQRLEVGRAIKRFLTASSPSPAIIEQCPPAARLDAYHTRATQNAKTQYVPVIEWLLEDIEAAATDNVRTEELIFADIKTRLEVDAPIPIGTWKLLHQLSHDTWFLRLVESEIPSKLVLAPMHKIDITGLASALAPYIRRPELPSELRRLAQRTSARTLPPADRLATLNELARETPNDRILLLELLDTLVLLERYSDAFLLAVAATRTGVIDGLSKLLHDTIRAVLVDAATKGTPEARDVALLLVVDCEWLVADADGATLVLFLSWALGVDELYHRVRYQWPSLFEEARETRPALIEGWLVPHLEGRDPIGADEQRHAILREARALQAQFEHELQRQSFFNRWDHAKGYMTLIKEALRHNFGRMVQGKPLEPLDLENIRRQGVHEGLPEIDNHRAMTAMENYVHEQWSRLEALASIRANLALNESEPLDFGSPPLRERVATESRFPNNASAAMRRVYAHVLEGT